MGWKHANRPAVGPIWLWNKIFLLITAENIRAWICTSGTATVCLQSQINSLFRTGSIPGAISCLWWLQVASLHHCSQRGVCTTNYCNQCPDACDRLADMNHSKLGKTTLCISLCENPFMRTLLCSDPEKDVWICCSQWADKPCHLVWCKWWLLQRMQLIVRSESTHPTYSEYSKRPPNLCSRGFKGSLIRAGIHNVMVSICLGELAPKCL